MVELCLLRSLGGAAVAVLKPGYGHVFEETSTAAMERLNEMIPEPAHQELRVVAAAAGA